MKLAGPAFALRQIEFDSHEYQAQCLLRDRVLRQPIGRSLFDEPLATEAGQLHFGAFAREQLLGCVTVAVVSENEVKLRQMAIDPGYQGQGIGRALIQFLEANQVSQGRRLISLHARVTALGFYQKLGYQAVADEFIELGLPHQRMIKRLAAPGAPQRSSS